MSDLRLLVPMNIEALVVGEDSRTEWGNLKPDFRGVYRLDQVLGQQLEKPMLFSPSTGLHKAGIHLHWALPDGLTHGVAGNNGGKPEFPSIPNRWLVVRFWDQARGKQNLDLRYKAWIVESDTVTADTTAAVWPTLPSQKLEKREDYFVFVGKQYEFSQWPGETKVPAPNVDITAMGYGDPAFAAYYPACKGILGFHDKDIADLQNANVAYVVVGWYSDPSKDPLQQALTDKIASNIFAKFAQLEKFLEKTQWIYQGFVEGLKKVKKTTELEVDRKETEEMITKLQNAQKEDATIDNSGAIAELQKKSAALQKELQRCSAANAELDNTLPTHILCHGIIAGIQWQNNPDSGVPRGKPFDLSIGDTAVESLSALFEKALSSGLGKLLAVFQYDLLSDLEKPDGKTSVDYKVHERSYGRLTRGIRWDLLQENRPAFGGSPEDRNPPMEDRAPPIPGDIRTLLEQLNIRQRRINRLKREQDSLRSELYAAWYKKVLNTKEKKVSDGALNQRLTKLQEEINELTVAITELEEKKERCPKGAEWEELQRQLNAFLPGWKLQQFDEPEFWRPNDPVVLMAGKAFQRAYRHGEDGRYRADGRLLCRLSGQEITGIKVKIPYAKEQKDVEFGSADVDKWGAPFASLGNRQVPPEVNNLFRESLLLTLEAKRVHAIVTAAYEKNEPGSSTGRAGEIENQSRELIDTYLKKVWQDARNPDIENPQLRYPETDKVEQTTWELVGAFPSPIVMSDWKKNPWLPLFLQWQVRWAPAYPDTLRALENWELTGQGTAFAWTGENGLKHGDVTYRGATLLTPSATLQFSDRLRQYNLTHDNETVREKLRTVQTAVSSMEVLCQSLGGLTDQFLMRKGLLELQPLEPGTGQQGPQFSPIYEAVRDVDWLSPLMDGKFLPIRSGHLTLEKLWVIDAFGQLLKLEEEDQSKGLQPVLPERLTGPEGSVRFEPRLTQPARLAMEWPSAGLWSDAGDADSARQEEQEFNPVCGWILPNFLDKSLMIYDTRGNALGALQAVQRKSWTQGVGALQGEIESFHWIDIPGSEHFFFGLPSRTITDPLGEEANPHLRAFVKGLLSLTEGRGQAFSDLLDKMNETFSSAGGAGSHHNPNLALLIGKPLALVRASLRLEVDGRIACAQGWDAVQGGKTDGLEQLKIPVRLGDRRKWQDVWLGDDGLVGFFLNQDYTKFYPAFGLRGRADDTYSKYSWAADPAAPNDRSSFDNLPKISIREPLDLTLLMDPTRGVCVTSGILPRAIFHLPYDDMSETLENKQVVFFTGPVVSPEGEKEIRMPQPSDLYGQWAWTHHPEVKVWGKDKTIVDVQKEQGRFSETPLQVAEGWLKLITAPLAVRVFTVKGKNPEPEHDDESARPERFVVTTHEKHIILTWSVSGAEKIELRREEASLFASHRRPLPTQYVVQVDRSATFTLVVTGRAEKSTEKESKPPLASKTIAIIVQDT